MLFYVPTTRKVRAHLPRKWNTLYTRKMEVVTFALASNGARDPTSSCGNLKIIVKGPQSEY